MTPPPKLEPLDPADDSCPPLHVATLATRTTHWTPLTTPPARQHLTMFSPHACRRKGNEGFVFTVEQPDGGTYPEELIKRLTGDVKHQQGCGATEVRVSCEQRCALNRASAQPALRGVLSDARTTAPSPPPRIKRRWDRACARTRPYLPIDAVSQPHPHRPSMRGRLQVSDGLLRAAGAPRQAGLQWHRLSRGQGTSPCSGRVSSATLC